MLNANVAIRAVRCDQNLICQYSLSSISYPDNDTHFLRMHLINTFYKMTIGNVYYILSYIMYLINKRYNNNSRKTADVELKINNVIVSVTLPESSPSVSWLCVSAIVLLTVMIY